jgi:PAS domain S-box-containing protein
MPHDECPMAIALREKRPVRGVEAVAERPDGTRIPFIPYPTPLFDKSGSLVGGLNMLVDVSGAKRAALNQHLLSAIVESSDDAIISKDLNGTITSWNRGAERLFGYTADEMIGQPILKLIPGDRQSEEDKILKAIRRGDLIDHYETVRRRKDGTLVEISLAVSPVRDQSGRIVGASKIARDITERRRAQEQQNLILNEIKHRIRNTLATVQAIAMQTMRTATTDERTAFAARLRTLAAAHDLLTLERWNKAHLNDLVSQALEPFADRDRGRFDVGGPELVLGANNALLITMALYELATNAVKYGALSNKKGRVAITWEALPGGEPRGRLVWRESGGPRVEPPSRKGFGSLLIERTLEDQGGSHIDYRPEGVACTLVFRL